MLKSSITNTNSSRPIRNQEGSHRRRFAKRLKPESLIRTLKQLLKTVKVFPSTEDGGSLPPDWPQDEADRWGEDDNHYYYFLWCPDSNVPDLDINYHKGMILIRVEK